MKLTNEEIARVYSMYLEQKVVFNDRVGIIHQYYLPAGKYKVGKMWYVSLQEDDVNSELSCSVAASDCRLLLTPLSKITDEHIIEICKWFRSDKDVEFEPDFKLIITSVKNKDFKWLEIDYRLHQQLILWGYNVPLYFGLNHWANGQTAIQLNLAIDKTTM